MGIVDIMTIVMNQFFSTSSSSQAPPVQAAENANAAFGLKRKHELEQDDGDEASLIKKRHRVGQI